LIVISLGSFLNTRFTGKLPLIAAWLTGFVVQALLRSLILGTPFAPALGPMTGVAFLLFTFYMVTDPATTPFSRSGQMAFGFSVALVYGVLQAMHVVFGLFFALFAVCLARAALLQVEELRVQRAPAGEMVR
jgi:Na+-translocating ferredoxin:NAD+ oxidoreductase RnfD subunit